MKFHVFILAVLLGTPVAAQERQALIDQIVKAGSHTSMAEHRSIEIRDCQMTSALWKNRGPEGWVLWSSRVFEMGDIRFTSADASGQKLFIELNRGTREKPKRAAIMIYRMREGTSAQTEKHKLRKTLAEKEPSPRGDGSSHYYEQQERFMSMWDWPGAVEDAHLYSEGFKTYVARYCTFIG